MRLSYSYITLLAATSSLELPRRQFIRAAAVTGPAAAANAATPAAPNEFQASACYRVVADSTVALAPKLEALTPQKTLQSIQKATAVWLGEHHNSARDHQLQASILKDLRASQPRRKLAVGFEAVQRQFQPVLDAFQRGDIGLAELKERTEWESRWFWPFERYAPVFEAARASGYDLLALNADSEDLGIVEQNGLAGLPAERLAEYVPSRRVFADFTNTTAFREYVAYVIAPSYRSHKEMGILRTTITGQKLDADMPFKNFYSGRMLWDNSMATTAATWTRGHPGGQFVGIIGSDHVKFGGGVANRYAYSAGLDLDAVRTVMLNPSAVDTAGPQLETAKDDASVGFTLQIRFAAQEGDGGIPVVRGDAPVDMLQAASVKQVRAGSRVLPLADLIIAG